MMNGDSPQAYPDAPIIVTSRIVGFREMQHRVGRAFEHVTVSNLSLEEKDDLARRWCDLMEAPERRASAAADLIRAIRSTDRIESLTGNPMLLTTLALMKRKVGKLPRRRADLYWEAVQVLLNWRSEVDEPMGPCEALPQLEYVAYAMCQRGIQRLREDEIIDLFERMRDEYPQIRDETSVDTATVEVATSRCAEMLGSFLDEAGRAYWSVDSASAGAGVGHGVGREAPVISRRGGGRGWRQRGFESTRRGFGLRLARV